MTEPRYKNLLVWEPFPFLVLFVLVVVAGSIRPSDAPVAFWIAAGLTLVATVYFVVAFIVQGRRSKANPDAEGNLRTLDGLTLIESAHNDDEVAPFVAVADVHRHQAAIEVTLTRGGDRVSAVLVPKASRWMGLRYRIGVQLVAGSQVRHVGFLPDQVERRWADQLGELRRANLFAQVPARIRGSARPFTVELDVSGLEDAIARRRAGTGA
ncbi:hypothetical protein WDJ51_01320 [Rathayibacter sp. YIM 133350]|uniref:hypothetical protein n=1 Tax=Rathayibacter sp. YIM 133350 TaxID=3131992 RepID=UPI00307EA624